MSVDTAAPEGAAPLSPEGTKPEGTKPEGAAPEGTKPEGAEPEGTKPEGAESKSLLASSPVAEDKPIEYDFTLPEDVQVDEGLLGKFKELAGQAKLPVDAAQSMVDLWAEQVSELDRKAAEATEAQFDKWREEFTSGYDSKEESQEALTRAKRVVEKYGDDGLKELLYDTGVGNHPSLLKFLAHIQQVADEEATVMGDHSDKDTRPLVERLYPSHYRKE